MSAKTSGVLQLLIDIQWHNLPITHLQHRQMQMGR